jgi:hypothetical protein
MANFLLDAGNVGRGTDLRRGNCRGVYDDKRGGITASDGPNLWRVEARAGLGLCRRRSVSEEWKDFATVKERRSSRDRVKQHLYLVYSAPTLVHFPTLTFQGKHLDPAFADLPVQLDRLRVPRCKICRPRHLTLVVDNENRSNRPPEPSTPFLTYPNTPSSRI